MTLLVIIAVALSVLFGTSLASFDLHGVKCGDKHCNISEYCSPYDTHCRSCSDACDINSRNYQPDECIKDCQVYLHDQRYVLRVDLEQYDDLRGEVERLRIMFTVTTTLTCFSLLGILYLLGRTLIRWEKIQNTLRALFSKNWAKATNKNKVQDDIEAAVKQNGLKLAMPTISATVEQEAKSNVNSNGTTPETTSTSLSRRYPSEDTTLDFAYDNPAMTPSPEAAQLRAKRESSF